MTDVVTKQNEEAYDAHASDWHAAMDSNLGHKYLEKPAMVSQLPSTLIGQTVLCIGVGSGEELQELLKRTPSKIVAVDISAELLAIASSKFPQVEFHKMDMNKLTFPDASFDLVYSSLTFHYAKDWDSLLAKVYRVLKRKGVLLFSTHHPDYWAAKPTTGNSFTNGRGIITTEHRAILPGEIEITYYNHQSQRAIVEAAEHAGFTIKRTFTPRVIEVSADELGPTNIDAYKLLKTKNEKAPLFFVITAVKD